MNSLRFLKLIFQTFLVADNGKKPRAFGERRNRYYCRAEAYIACDLRCVGEHVWDRHGRASVREAKCKHAASARILHTVRRSANFRPKIDGAPETDPDQSQLPSEIISRMLAAKSAGFPGTSIWEIYFLDRKLSQILNGTVLFYVKFIF